VTAGKEEWRGKGGRRQTKRSRTKTRKTRQDRGRGKGKISPGQHTQQGCMSMIGGCGLGRSLDLDRRKTTKGEKSGARKPAVIIIINLFDYNLLPGFVEFRRNSWPHICLTVHRAARGL